MNLKHKVIKDFQYLSPDKKIFTLKTGTIIEEYTFKIKSETIDMDKDVIANNPDFFEIVDWRAELLSYLKSNKIPQPALLSKKLIPFINEMIVSIEQPITKITIDTSLEDKERLKEKEEEYELRNARLQRKEEEYLEDIKSLRNKEESYRADFARLSKKELEIQESLKNINDKQRKYDIQLLENINDDSTDEKYKIIENKIAQEYKEISEREAKLQNDINDFQEDLKNIENLKESIKEYNLYLDERLALVYDWKEKVLNNWNYALYPIQDFPIIEKRDFS